MKNIIIGFFLGILFFISAYIIYDNTSFVDNNIIETSNIKNNNKEKYIGDNNIIETSNIKNNNKEKYIGDNNIKEISNIKDINTLKYFKTKSTFSEILLFLSIKERNKKLWNFYWLDIYNKNINTSKIYDLVSNNKLNLFDYKKIILDGSIFLSNANLEDKKIECNNFFNKINNNKENIINCINLSYIYESIINNNINLCDKINIKGIFRDLKENCKSLFKKND